MTRTKLFATAAVMSALMATPVLAQSMQGQGAPEMSQNTSQRTKQQMKNPSVRQNARMSARADEMTTRDNWSWDRDDRRSDSGFFPLDAAVGITSGAVATAGAIATAPFGSQDFGGQDYAYNDGYRANDGYVRGPGYRDSFASVNNYPRIGAFASQPYTNPYENNRVAQTNNGFLGQRNNFVCVPGTVFTNENGIRVLCQ
jgi:hypothetical protein